jgi:alpha-L-fucosidase
MAQRAGMKYLVITSKHHDGFALWPSRHGEWNVGHASDTRDIIGLVADACRRHDVVPCWYHSIMDWHHPDYLPRRDWERGGRPENGASMSRYVEFLHGQVEELLTQYGDIGVMWFDGEWESTWTHELGAALADKCRALQPHIIVNNRVAPNRGGMGDATVGRIGDFGTPEQNIPETGLPGVDWESCITMNQNWGYNRADKDFKSVAKLVSMLVDTSSKGGNLLLNVGPMASGELPPESVDRLQGLARWMDVHGDAIHATAASPFAKTSFRATRSPANDRINVFLSDWPRERELLLPGLRTLPTRATMMGTSRLDALPTRRVDNGVVVTLPAAASDTVCSVLRLESHSPMQIG